MSLADDIMRLDGGIKDVGLSAPKTQELGSLSELQLLSLRSELDNHLKIKLEDIDLTEELALQFKQAKALYANIANDDEIQANQKAQVLNTVSSIIGNITKSQAELYNAERLKRLESAILKALKTLPTENQKAFLELYGEYLAGP